MQYRISKYFFCVLAICSFTKVNAQTGLCPENLDFEQGTFANWFCQTGFVAAVGGVNTITWTGAGQVPGRQTMIDASTAGVDPYGGFPTLCPNGSNYSVRLGNSGTGAQAEGLSYTFTIPASATNFSILYYYAVVLQDPSHFPEEQPRFRARLVDVTTNAPLPCVTFDFTASASLPGFRRSNLDPSVWYKDWTPITINLRGYGGHTVMLEFITSDCTRNGHFGYAYMDVFTVCNGAIPGSTVCVGDTETTLTAPFGFQTYTWYADNTFTTVLSNTQTLTLTPPPTIGSRFPVIVTPYPGFGCQDTLYADITVSPPPTADAGADANVCQSQQAQIGGPPTPGYVYAWTPAAQVSNPNISNPFAWNSPPNPTEFIIKTTDLVTGCSSYDTTVVASSFVDTSLQLTGKDNFCINEAGPTLTLSSTVAAIQWHELTNGPIPGETNATYLPTSTGSYWAEVTQNGCIDSTRTVAVNMHPLPIPSYNLAKDSGCVNQTSFVIGNTSTSPDGANMTYVWTFSDGNTQTTPDAVKTFSGGVGTYSFTLEATTEFGCIATTPSRNLHLLPNGIPDFTWDSICVGKPIQFRNLSNENNSAKANYSWDFNNGGAPSPVKNPAPVIYNTLPGPRDVTLKMTTLGCESDTQTVRKIVQVNKQAPGIRYHDLTVPEGTSKYIHARDTIGNVFNWRPAIQLSSYGTQYTQYFGGSNDVTYFIDISDIHTCVTTDTMQMLVLKKPGFYLPTAFTPNDDGLNDVVKPYLIGMKGLKSFSVFNRWGSLIFLSTKYGEGWDGKSKGVAQNAGVYIWILQFYDSNDKLVTEKGTLTLIR